ncbi:uncharacterized protein I206_102347 [Kwoniella pini CBS 10737]|uniref:Metal resistance protein ycf1 n=1 Tax=Kwoniella pini CBS 10737 TaxID=1296096 RepID=A0A1B9I552_9TREE|nr:metal resistance protein ycf1 [Kwoniella pini CBS 10737]OCF50640.1 metal resistance protein ycf1 [Kwoniella pini CBS 10737]
MALQATFEALRSHKEPIYRCSWPLQISSQERDLDFTQCFEHAVLLPAPLVLAILIGTAQIFSISRRLKKLQEQGGLIWQNRTKRNERICTLKLHLLSASAIFTLVSLGLSFAHVRQHILSTIHYALLLLAQLTFIHLTQLNHHTSRTSSTLILLFWPAYLLIFFIRLRTMILTGDLSSHLTSTLAGRLIIARESFWFLSLVVGLIGFLFELYSPEKRWKRFRAPWSKKGKIALAEDEEDDEEEALDGVDSLDGDGSLYRNGKNENGDVESPISTANIYERLTFSWLTPLLSLGTRKFLGEEDMWALPSEDSAESLSSRLTTSWQNQVDAVKDGKKKKPSLTLAIIRAFGAPYFVAGLFKGCYDILNFLQPQLLRLLLSFVSSYGTDHPHPPVAGFAISILMFISANVATAILHQYFQRCFETTMRIRGGLVTLIYRKTFVLSNGEKAGRTTGDIVNLQSVDAVRIGDVCQYGHIAWSGPFQILIAFISLYRLVGWQAFMGVAVMIFSLPANTILNRINKRYQRQMMKIKDTRTRTMNEILNNIKSIKLYGWEKSFADKIYDIRNNQELKMLRRIGINQAFVNFIWQGTPFLVAFSTFATFALTSGKPLTSEIIFPAISLFQLLSFPMAMFANIINSIIEASVSLGRLEDFLSGEELDPNARTLIRPSEDPQGGPRHGDAVVSIKNGEFRWVADSEQPTLENIDLEVKKGELFAIIGRVGDGKSSLLGSMLGEMTRSEGSVTIRGEVAYFSQNSWILSATVKDNIVFGHRFDPTFYEEVLEACALKQDLAILPSGDKTEVGEKGVSLSGGQKARISLARAVYARADLYLLDDPLAAVDSHVGRHIFDKVIGPNGILKGKARVLCTNAVTFLPQADQIVMLRRGIILERGQYDEAMNNTSSELYKLITGLGKQSAKSEEESDGSSSPTVIDEEEDEENSSNEKEEEAEIDDTASLRKRQAFRRMSTAYMRRSSVVSVRQAKRDAVRDLRESAKPKEHSEKGNVKKEVYKDYISAASKIGVVIFLAAMMSGQGLGILSNFVLRSWASLNTQSNDTTNVVKYLTIYGIVGISGSILNVVSFATLKLVIALNSGRKLHDRAFGSLMRSPLSFFELTPTGRILNLFSRDIFVIDEVLIFALGSFFRTTTQVVGTVAVIAYGAPFVLLVFIPLGFLYRMVMRYYLATSRELKRLDAVSRSPIFSFFGETLSGLPIIRGYGQKGRFIANNEARIDRNQACYMPAMTINRWLAVRLEFLGSCLMFSTALVSVIALINYNSVDAGLVGLLMSYTISVTGTLNWLVRSASEVEQNIVSVERVLGYANLPSEAPDFIEDKKPSKNWPEQGVIEFDKFSMRYRPELELCLREVSVKINGGERVGVVGRTGAGKSSLTLALFRILEAAGGRITIDGIDISTIGLHDLRSVVSIIPQDPQLFEGSLRNNIDPTNVSSDADIWQALTQAHLKDHVTDNMGGSLDAEITEGGSNLSAGQRQLVCFARALLRKTKILVLDEATSSIDLETDEAVQDILRGTDFKGITTITIAHRINTILDSDKVLVMSDGKVAEYDSPEVLVEREESLFASLVKESGLGKKENSTSNSASKVASRATSVKGKD